MELKSYRQALVPVTEDKLLNVNWKKKSFQKHTTKLPCNGDTLSLIKKPQAMT
jgi:hypothetical protein